MSQIYDSLSKIVSSDRVFAVAINKFKRAKLLGKWNAMYKLMYIAFHYVYYYSGPFEHLAQNSTLEEVLH